MSTTAQVDKKGRLTLGRRFAGKMVIVQNIDASSVVVTAAVVIPEREAWLYQNKAALAAVRCGLQQARKRQFTIPAKPNDDEALARQLDDCPRDDRYVF